MIELWQALLLSLVQGLTEFLPISSSAHLILPSLLLGWPDQGLAFDVAVHFGTLLAVLLYFRRDLLDLAADLIQAARDREVNDGCREVSLLVIATVPAIISGFMLNAYMDSLRTMPVLITTTIVFALLLGFADRRVKASASSTLPSVRMALLIGVAQAIAPIPGTSRSGITITAALLLGMSRSAAARFSFLLSIPVIGGAMLLKMLELFAAQVTVPWLQLGVSMIVAAISAYLCIAVFLNLIERVGMMPFVLYRLALGLVLLALWWV